MSYREHELPFDSFIGGWFIPEEICDELIDCFKSTNELTISDGCIRSHEQGVVDTSVKESRDLTLYNNTKHPGFRKYQQHLLGVANLYNTKYTFAFPRSDLGTREGYNIQWYPKNGGYKEFHCERCSPDPIELCRHLVFMTYLTDVVGEGGETEFYYQKLKIKPKKGLTLIWPSDWTHTHRGIPAPDEEKVIITGWIHYEN